MGNQRTGIYFLSFPQSQSAHTSLDPGGLEQVVVGCKQARSEQRAVGIMRITDHSYTGLCLGELMNGQWQVVQGRSHISGKEPG
jgi:hypothetical protein